MKVVNNGSELAAALKEARKYTGDDFADILKKLIFDGMRNLIKISAVDSGYLRSKWQVSVNSEPSNTTTKGSKGATYSPAAPKVTAEIKAGSIVVLYNNTEYAIHLENGTPHMAAQPMVAPTYIYLEALAMQLCKILSEKGYNV
jgi:hypothetical protein